MNDGPNPAPYEALAEALLDIERRASSSNINALAASYEALGAVIEFLNNDARIVEREAVRPLSRLMLAVLDRRQGAKPRLFFDTPDRKGAKGAPSYTSEIILRSLLNCAFHSLRQAGISKRDAADWLAGELRRSGIRQPNGRLIPARAIARWGDELGHKSLKGSDWAFGAFVYGAQHTLREAGVEESDPRAHLSKQKAQTGSRAFIKLLKMAGF